MSDPTQRTESERCEFSLDDCEMIQYPFQHRGGQMVGLVKPGVLIIHRPTGLAALSLDEHSQLLNRRAAERKLRDLLTHPAALPQEGETGCVWTMDEVEIYDTACGERWEFTVGTPAENKVRFCMYCGKPLVDRAARRAP